MKNRIGDFELDIPRAVKTGWSALPLDGAWLSLASCGDMGPSGDDMRAAARRVAAVAELDSRLTPPLVCRQVHSLNVVVLQTGTTAELYSASWEGAKSWRDLRPDRKKTMNAPLVSEENLASGDIRSWVGKQEADGILTNLPGTVLGITVADCMPILLQTGEWAGALHSGWAGTGILAVAIELLRSLSNDRAIGPKILLGPCILPHHYPVDPERAAVFRSRFGDEAVRLSADGKTCLDLRQANVSMLNSLPDLAWSVRQCVQSTFDSPFLHSYRRDGPESYGRMLCIFAKR